MPVPGGNEELVDRFHASLFLPSLGCSSCYLVCLLVVLRASGGEEGFLFWETWLKLGNELRPF